MMLSEVKNDVVRSKMREIEIQEVKTLLSFKPNTYGFKKVPPPVKIWYFISKDIYNIATLKWTATQEQAVQGEMNAKRQGLALREPTVNSVETYVGSLLHKQALKFRV